MTLSDEEYKRLDAEYAAEREFFEAKAEQYPFLKDVMASRKSFAEKEIELFAEYQRDQTAIADLDFGSFVGIIEDIAGIELNVFDRMLMETFLLILDEKPGGYTAEGMFKPIAEACAELDRRIRRCYSLAFLRQMPEAFEEECSTLEPAELEYARIKVFEQLDAEYAAFGETLNFFCEQYGFVEQIVDGKATFADTAHSLVERIDDMLPSFRELLWKLPTGEVPERSKPYLEELVSFTDAVDELTGEEIEYEVLNFRSMVGYALGGSIIMKKGWNMYIFIDEEFERYLVLSEKLDRKLCLHLSPRFVTEAPDRFREAYSAAHSLEKEYVRDRLLKAVGAGAVRGMSEDELLKFLNSLGK